MISGVSDAARRVSGAFVAFALCLGLSACATDGFSFSPRRGDVDRQTLPPPIYQADSKPGPSKSQDISDESALPVLPSLPGETFDFPSLADQMNRSGVIVYGLDDPAGPGVYDPAPAPRRFSRGRPRSEILTLRPPPGIMERKAVSDLTPVSLVPEPSGVPSAADSSVLVFPLDGGSFALVGTGATPTRIAPEYLLPDLGMPASPDRTVETASLPEVETPAPGAPLRIYFDHNSARLGAGAKKALTNVASTVKNAGGAASVVVEGHASRRAVLTDPAGREALNLKKSLDRAYAVSNTLIRQGVPVESIVTTGYGDGRTAPVPDDRRDAEAASRRVDVRLTP